MARIARRIGWGLLALAVPIVIAALWAVGPGNLGRMVFGVGSTYDREAPRLPAMKRPAVLIFSKTNSFRDDAQIRSAHAALEKVVKNKGWANYTTESAAVFNPAQLSQFDAVVWNSVSGDVLTDEQRAAFKGWIEQGGGFVALHGSGGDPSYKWRWYVENLIGAQFIGHTLSPHIQQARLVVEDRNHPATRHLPAIWTREDEWYSFATSPRAKGYHVLISIDERSYSPREHIPLFIDKDLRMGRDHPMVWTHCEGKGRVFYSALGHPASAYAEPAHLSMITGAIVWASGREGPACPLRADQSS